MPDDARDQHPDRVRAGVRALGNLLLGVAIGLLSYYAVTDLLTRLEQQGLRAEVPPIAYEHIIKPGPTLDFEGWASEDRAYWQKLPRGGAFGRLVIDRMKLDAVVVKGHKRQQLMKGPGWITYTSLPGPFGNCGISGHRTTYGAPFRDLDRLKPGDTIEFYSPYRRYTYKVRRVFTVRPDGVGVLESTKQPVLTLTACHPPYSARLRLIVQSDLVEVRRLGDSP